MLCIIFLLCLWDKSAIHNNVYGNVDTATSDDFCFHQLQLVYSIQGKVIALYDTCVGRSKVERTFYHALLIRLFVDHSYDRKWNIADDRTSE